MHIGIIGPSASGKTTLFQALSALKTTPQGRKNEPSRAVIQVPDERVDKLSALFNPKKTTYATTEYIDVPHPGGSEAYPKGYMQNFRTADTLAIVLRAFTYPGEDPKTRQKEALDEYQELELAFILNDLVQIEKKLEMERKLLKGKKSDPKSLAMVDLLERLHAHLEEEKPIRNFELTPDEEKELRGYTFLSQKPQILVLNIDETMLEERHSLLESWKKEFPHLQILAIPSLIEAEMSELPDEERELFLAEYGVEEPALPAFIRASYKTLDLISFFTVGEDEVRAWTIPRGTNAQKAAGAIHSDLERGFIRAEVIDYADLLELGSLKAAKDKGILRLEGKTYIVQDGDILHIRFAV